MPLNLDDIGGAKELAMYRIAAAKEDLEAAEDAKEQLETAKEVVIMVENYLKT